MEEIAPKVWKLNVDSNVYFLDLDEKIVIDTGPPNYQQEVMVELGRVVNLEEIEKVVFTHLHYDHIGNFDLFPNAEFYTSEEEIAFFNKDKSGAILDSEVVEKFNVKLLPLKKLEGFDIIKTPGHTIGSFCLFYKKDKILFTGDTLFRNGYGRLDLPSSVLDKMEDSLKLIEKIDYMILAPGHDY